MLLIKLKMSFDVNGISSKFLNLKTFLSIVELQNTVLSIAGDDEFIFN